MKAPTLIHKVMALSWVQKLLTSDWSFPSFDAVMPVYYSLLSGFVASTMVGLVASKALVPQAPSKMSTNQKSGVKDKSVPPAELPPRETEKFEHVRIALPAAPLAADFRTIASRNLFNSEGDVADGEDGVKPQCELKKSELPLKFTGLIFGGTTETSLVVLESNATKLSEIFIVGDKTPGDAFVVGIEKDRVILERPNGCSEYLVLEAEPLPKRRVANLKGGRAETKASTETTGDGFREDGFERRGLKSQVDKRWVEKTLGIDFAKTLQDAKAVANVVGKDVKGFILTKIRPNSVYEKLGIVDGDIIEAINGIELNGMAQAVQTLNYMRNESTITFTVKRNGQPVTMSINIR